MPGQGARRALALKAKSKSVSIKGSALKSAVKRSQASNKYQLGNERTRVSVDDVIMSEGAVRPILRGRETRRQTSLEEMAREELKQLNKPKSKKVPGKSFHESSQKVEDFAAHQEVFENADVEVRKSPYYSDLKTRDSDAKIYTADWFYYKVTKLVVIELQHSLLARQGHRLDSLFTY